MLAWVSGKGETTEGFKGAMGDTREFPREE